MMMTYRPGCRVRCAINIAAGGHLDQGRAEQGSSARWPLMRLESDVLASTLLKPVVRQEHLRVGLCEAPPHTQALAGRVAADAR